MMKPIQMAQRPPPELVASTARETSSLRTPHTARARQRREIRTPRTYAILARPAVCGSDHVLEPSLGPHSAPPTRTSAFFATPALQRAKAGLPAAPQPACPAQREAQQAEQVLPVLLARVFEPVPDGRQ